MIVTLKYLVVALAGGAFLLAVGILLFLWFVRRCFRRVIQEEESLIPCRVKLVPEPNPQWKNNAKMLEYIGGIKQLGFKPVGAFQIPQLRGLLIQAFYHPTEGAYSTVYDHLQIAPTFDMVREFVDGFGVSVTNNLMGESLDPRPGTKTYRLPNTPYAEMFNTLKSHQHEAALDTHEPERFQSMFEKSYSDYMNWRLTRGGVYRDEIKRQAKQSGKELSQEELDRVWEAEREKFRRQVHAGCIAEFLETNNMPAARWEQISDRAIVIGQPFELKDIVEVLSSHFCLDDEQRHVLENLPVNFGETGLDLAEKIVSLNIAGLGLSKLGQVQIPAPALLLLSPDNSLTAAAA